MCSTTVTIPFQVTSTYWAYISKDHPTSGPPTDVLRTALPVSVVHLGWLGTAQLTASVLTVDSSNPMATVTLSETAQVPPSYAQTIYDESNHLVGACLYSISMPPACPAAVTIPFGATKTYTAYISMDHPQTGPPTNVLRTAGPVSITHLGWHDTMELAASASTVDSSNPTATLTLSESGLIPWGYAQTIYDESNHLVRACTYPILQGCSATVTIPFEATKTYTAYISMDSPATGPPTNVYRTAGSVSITHLGWLGTAQFTSSASRVDSSNPTATLTLSESAPIPWGYAQTIYDESNHLVGLCTYPIVQGCSTTVTIPLGATKAYTAYISQGYPTTGPPTDVLRTAGAVVVTTLSDAELTNLLLNGTDSQLAGFLGVAATPETIAALRAGALRLLTDEGACQEIGAADPTHPAGSSATSTQLACGTGASAVVAVLFGALGVVGATTLLVNYGTDHPTVEPEPEPQPLPDPIVPGGPNDPPATVVDTCQIPPGEPDTYRHYTTENGRAAIVADGAINSLSGTNYLTVAIYASGLTARADLALGSTPTGYFEVPRERLPNLEGPECVTALNGEPGGGVEYWTNQPISVEGLTWVPIGP